MSSASGSGLPRERAESLPLRSKLSLATEIVAVYCRVRWRLARGGLRATLAAVREAQRPASQPVGDPRHTYLRVARLASAVRRTLNLLPTDSRCLMQSLVLTALLARRGVWTDLIIGVKLGPEFRAHAWVEYGGRTVPPGSEASYQRLAEL